MARISFHLGTLLAAALVMGNAQCLAACATLACDGAVPAREGGESPCHRQNGSEPETSQDCSHQMVAGQARAGHADSFEAAPVHARAWIEVAPERPEEPDTWAAGIGRHAPPRLVSMRILRI